MKRKRFLKYSLLLGGLGFLKTSRLSAFFTQTQKLFLNKVKFIWSGGIATDSVKVHAKLTTATTSARLVASTDPTLTNPVFGPFSVADAGNNYIARLTVNGLQPNTEYYYGIEADGVIDTASDAIGRFKTFASSHHSFLFSIASCNSNGNHPVFYRIKEKDPLFHITHGDFHYADPNSATDINVHRQPFENTLAQPAMKEFLRNHAIAYMWDDHDYCGDNTNSLATGRTNARLVYQEYVPHYPLVAGSGDVPIYQSFTVGRIKFILSDLRSEKTAPGTSIMGAAQKAWFKNECIDAKSKDHVIVWISSVPWGGTSDLDTWAGFPEERTELSDFFKSIGIKNLLIICGDAHMIAFDDGTNHDFSTGGSNPYKYPVLQAAAVNQTGSFRGGTFSHGFFTNPTQQHGQYAALDIADDGGSNIGFTITGYRVASDGSEQVLITTTINLPVLSVLPIKVSAFSVTEAQQKGKALLTWEMHYISNTQCKQMIVERSSDGFLFNPIHKSDCSASIISVSRHSFVDENPLQGKNYYRIQTIDQNGKVDYSGIEVIAFHKSLSVDILDNPVKKELKLVVTSERTTLGDYTILDANGRTVIKKNISLHPGQNSVNIPMYRRMSGVYFFNLRAAGQSVSKKFVLE